MIKVLLNYIKSSFLSFSTNFSNRILYIIILIIMLTSFFVGVNIYDNSLENTLNKYRFFDDETFVLDMPHEQNDPFLFNSSKDLKLLSIENIIYTRYHITEKRQSYNNSNINVIMKGTTNNFILSADRVDLNYSRNNLLNLKKNEIIYGRNWSNEEFQSSKKVALVYESTALRLFGIKNAVGKKLHLTNESFDIIGVLADSEDIKNYNFHYNDEENLNIVLYTPITIFEYPLISYSIIRTEKKEELLNILKTEINKEIKLVSKDDIINDALTFKRQEMQSFFYTLIILLLLLLLGSIKIVSNFINSMRLEIAIKRSLGSLKNEIFFSLISQIIFMFLISLCLSILFSLAISYIYFFAIYKYVFPFITTFNIQIILLFGIFFLIVNVAFSSIYIEKNLKINIIDGLKGNK